MTQPLTTHAPDLIARLAEVPAERIALVADGRDLTFGELREAAGRVAAGLAERGVGRESVVAISLPRGVDLVVALLGTLTAGAAYLPVDPALPPARKRYLLDDSGADVLIDADSLGDVLAEASIAPVAVGPDALAYVIYTSGSTGLPKGVEVTRRNAAILLADLEAVGVAATTAGRVGWNASASFDASVQQWTRLCRGDTVVMVDDATRADPALLAQLVADQALTDLDLTPTHADALIDHLGERTGEPLSLLIGGEPINPALWRRLVALVDAGIIRAANLYGPTETTVDATVGWLGGDTPTIGSVLPGLRLMLLDDKLNPVGDGELGEIYLGGARVARGYRRRPRLTAERFVADLGGDGGRMYRTGDLARRRADGALEYVGRRDGQVKVRGYRVELGEVEAALCGHPGVTEVAVALREDSLVAYVRGDADPEELTAHAATTLPPYMVPSRIVPVAEFARTVNGKLDRDALPDPAEPAPSGTPAEVLAGPVEEMIGEVWSQVLRKPHIRPDDNFFKLGGHSLLAIKLVARVRTDLRIALPVKAAYQHPRLRDLARHIESLLAA
ncbi:non-ribosomal peptide synthetase [Actinokineospora sp. 24-640]